MAAKKRPLDISDIQDETDIYDRLVIKQRKAKRNLVLNDKQSRHLLSDQVKRVDEKRKGRPLAVKPQLADSVNDSNLDDELPVIVESTPLRNERTVESIPDVQDYCREIVKQYDDLVLSKIFSDTEKNFMFRLFVSAASFGQLYLLTFPEDVNNLYVTVLRNIVSKQKARKTIQDKFSHGEGVNALKSDLGNYRAQSGVLDRYIGLAKPTSATPSTSNSPNTFGGQIIRTSEKFPVPKHITRLLEDAM